MIVKLYNDTVEIEFREASHRYKVDGVYNVGVSTVLGVLAKDLMGWAAWMSAEAFKEAVKPFATTSNHITQAELKKLADTAKKAHQVRSQRGKDVGSIAHAWIEEETAHGVEVTLPQYVKNLLDEQADKPDQEIETIESEIQMINDNYAAAKHCVDQWRKWKQDYDVQVIKSEFIVHSKKLGYCGTVDVLFRSKRDGKIYIADYKTSEPVKIRNSRYQITGHKAYPEHFAQVAGYDYAHHEEFGLHPDSYAVLYLPKEGKYQMFSRETVKEDRQGWEDLFKVYKWIDSIKKGK